MSVIPDSVLVDPRPYFKFDILLILGPFTLAKTVYTARKTHNIRGFGTKSACAKISESHTFVLISGAHAWLLTTFDRTRVVRIIDVAGRGRVIPLKVTYHVTKNLNNTGVIGANIYIGKQPVKFRRSFKKSRCGGGFLDSGFLECLGEVA